LLADLSSPPIERRSWVWTLGPAFAGLFIWIPLLDPIGAMVVGETSLGWLAATAVLAAIACHALLYSIPALWGWQAGRRLSLVAASAFGTDGSEWITGVCVGLAAVLIQAVSISVAIRLTLQGLVSCHLAGPSALESWKIGPLVLESPVTLMTALFWIFVTGMASLLRLVGVISALMQVYTPVAFLLLGATAGLTSAGLAGFEAARLGLHVPAAHLDAGASAARLFQVIFGAFALSGMMAVEWGMAVRNRRDIRIGGWLAIVLAGSYAPVMSLLVVAGAVGKSSAGLFENGGDSPLVPPSFHGAVFLGIGGALGGVILLLFGLATLAPACYSAWVSSRRFAAHWPGIRRFYWTWICGCLAFVLVATSWAGRLEDIFGLLGAAFAPAVGAMVGLALRHSGQWRGIREGWNVAGVAAWTSGVLVGLLPLLGTAIDWPRARSFQPASLYAYFVSVMLAWLLSALGLERPLVSLPEVAQAQAETRGAEPTAGASQ
jgi:hypothetical protein